MEARYVVQSVDMGNGEWMPLLVDSATGCGMYEPTAYSFSLRSKGRTVNTLTRALGAVAFLYETLAESNIDLMERARNDEMLSLGEIEGLVARCRYFKSELRLEDEETSRPNVLPHRKTLAKNKAAHYGLATVESGTTAGRLYYIAGYLEWFSKYVFLSKIPQNRNEFLGISAVVLSAIRERIPPSSDKRKKGLTKQQENRLFAVVDPASPENPWKQKFIRNRNYLIIRLLRDLGIRKGELLGVKINDVDFRKNVLLVALRPDDPDDPRRRQPEAKTLGRELPLGDDLSALLRRYIDEDRYCAGMARRHPFLIVKDEGEPLALNSVDFIFSTLREKFPELAPISAHYLRHTWNDAFSQFAKKKFLPAEEVKIRNYLMGWADGSKMASNYTARFVEEEGREALLAMQNSVYEMVKQ